MFAHDVTNYGFKRMYAQWLFRKSAVFNAFARDSINLGVSRGTLK